MEFTDRPPIDFATSRAHSIKRSTTGLSVRCFSVTMAKGHGRMGKSTGNMLRDCRFGLNNTADLPKDERYGPFASKWIRTAIEKVTKLGLGGSRRRLLNASIKCE